MINICGRYLVDDGVYADIWEMLNTSTQNLARGEVFPTNIAPVIARDGIMAVKWGFPHWKGTGVIINARAETASEKNMFRKPLFERRCVVLSGGFFEWSRDSGGKLGDKFLLRQPGKHLLYMAGMISIFRDAAGNEYSAFVILTTSANDSIAPIHSRMPVILESDEQNLWINDGGFCEYALHRVGPELEPELLGTVK